MLTIAAILGIIAVTLLILLVILGVTQECFYHSRFFFGSFHYIKTMNRGTTFNVLIIVTAIVAAMAVIVFSVEISIWTYHILNTPK